VKVSVLTVCYESAKYIRENFASVTAQTYGDIEHIIIDGGSTDKTVSYIKEYAQSSKNVVWVSEPDRGMYDALNKAVAAASGDIIYCLNSDDMIKDSHVIERVVSFMSGVARNESGLYIGDVNFQYSTGLNSKRRAISVSAKQLVAYGNCTFVPQPATFAFSSLYKRAGPFDVTYKIASDYDFIIRLLGVGKSLPLGFTTTHFRRHDESLTESQSDAMREESKAIRSKYIVALSIGPITAFRMKIVSTLRYIFWNPIVLFNRFFK